MNEIDYKRWITGLALSIALGAVILLQHSGIFAFIIIILALLAYNEYCNLMLPSDSTYMNHYKFAGTLFLIFIIYSVLKSGALFLATLFLLAFITYFVFILIGTHYGKSTRDTYSTDLKGFIIAYFGLFYIMFLLAFLPAIYAQKNGFLHIFVLAFGVWMSDTGAYMIGKKFGKRKLIPVLSPGKTVEGVFGGLGFAVVSILIFKFAFFKELSFISAIILAIGCSVLGVLGDLFESFIKRAVGVKDSGSLIPGHGGILDRIDALVFASGFYFCYISIF